METQPPPAAISSFDPNEKAVVELPSTTPIAGFRASFTSEQDKAFDEFLALCRNGGLLDDPLGHEEHECRDGIDDDTSLYRFFTARGCDAQKAFVLFEEAVEARKVNEMAEFYRCLELELYEETRLLYPYWTGRRDKRGIPVYLFDLKLLNPTTLAAHRTSSESEKSSSLQSKNPAVAPVHIRRSYAVHDHLTRFVIPLCSAIPNRPNPEMPVTKHVIIADITGLGLSSAWKLRDWAQSLGKILAVNYPELVDQGLVIGAPSYFGAIWSWAKLLLDPVTASKVRVLAPQEVLPVLESYMNIEDIPQKYGGKLPTEPGMMPMLDKHASDLLERSSSLEKSIPQGPIHFVKGPNGSRKAVAVGIENGEQRRVEFATVR